MPLAKTIRGHIPEKLIYICQPEETAHQWFGDLFDEDEKQGTGTKVTPAFCVDEAAPKTHETARNWARGWHKKKLPPDLKRDNTPIKGLRIVTLEERSEGGRAYKVVTTDGYYFDLREDTMLDTILNGGIGPGGVLSGEYVWAKVGSQMKLVRVGGAIHKRLIESTERRDLKPGDLTLEPGGVYRTKAGKYVLFVDFVATAFFKVTRLDGKKPSHYDISSYYGVGTPVKVSRKDSKKALLFMEIPDYALKDSPTKRLKEQSSGDSLYLMKVTETHTCVEKIRDAQIPKGTVEALREQAAKSAREYAKSDSGSVKERINNLAHNAELACMGDADQPITIPAVLKELNDAVGKETK